MDMKSRIKSILKLCKINGITLTIVDVDDDPILENKYWIDFLPSYVLLVDGKEIDREYGNMTNKEFNNFLVDSLLRQPLLIYTVGSIDNYDEIVKANLAYKQKGTQVWSTYKEAVEYVGRVWVNDKNVPARVYGVKANWDRDVYNGNLKRNSRMVMISDDLLQRLVPSYQV